MVDDHINLPRPCAAYIVAGGGRTGSHWLEQIVQFLTSYQSRRIDDLVGQGWVAHSNNINALANVPATIRQVHTLLIIKRQDTFAQALSHIIAERTNEWFSYTSQPVQPFEIDPEIFRMRMQSCQAWNTKFDCEIRPIYKNIIDFNYEELVAHSDRVEDHVAQRLAVANQHGHKDWSLNRNPRDYQYLVKNYQDLAG